MHSLAMAAYYHFDGGSQAIKLVFLLSYLITLAPPSPSLVSDVAFIPAVVSSSHRLINFTVIRWPIAGAKVKVIP